MGRVKTRFVGVYYRYGKNRYLANGKPDKCFDIHYKAHDKYIFEKIGWQSEGYTVEDAITIRGQRVKALRHPELCPDNVNTGITLDEAWVVYQEKWLPNRKKASNIENIYNFYLGSRFGKRYLASITTLDIETFKQDLLKQKKKTSENTLLPSTVKEILACFRGIINKANEWNLTTNKNHNPVSHVTVPNSDRKRERYLQPKEAEKLLDGLQYVSCLLYEVAYIALHTGMRLNEILGLKGQQIDIESGTINLNGKTGKRPAYIDDQLKQVLQKIIPQDRSRNIFLTAKGNPVSMKWFSKKFAESISDIGFNKGITDNSQKIVFHTLRHTFCSWLAIKGVPLFTIGELVGHRSIEMTKRYAKLSPDSKREALKFINLTLDE